MSSLKSHSAINTVTTKHYMPYWHAVAFILNLKVCRVCRMASSVNSESIVSPTVVREDSKAQQQGGRWKYLLKV